MNLIRSVIYGIWELIKWAWGKDDELASIAYPSYEHSDFERIEKKAKRKLTKTTKYIIQFVTIVMGVIFILVISYILIYVALSFAA